MNACFAAAALRLSGLVPRTLGWRPREFWSATPAELAAILEPAGPETGTPLTRGEMNDLMERERDG